MSQKVKFAFYLPQEKKEELERRYREDGSRSITAFVENAVGFYLDYLSANNAGAFLPAAVKSVIEGGLGCSRTGWPVCCSSKPWSRTWP